MTQAEREAIAEQDRQAHEWLRRIDAVQQFSDDWYRLMTEVSQWLKSIGRPSLFATYND